MDSANPTDGASGFHISEWLPDETLFSLCSREHVLSGAKVSAGTTLRLFGDMRRGSYHDIPAELDYFVQTTRGELGESVMEICRDHTVLRFYLPWRDSAVQMEVVARVSGNQAGSVKALLGIPSGRFGAQHPLKFCPQCLRSDQADFGVGYWHVNHQIPAVWVCPVHGSPLIRCGMKRNGIGRFLWGLPPQHQIKSTTAYAPGEWLACRKFGELALAATQKLKDISIDYVQLNRAYRYALREANLIKGQNSLRIHEIAERYGQYLTELKVIDEFEQLSISTETCISRLRHVLYPKRVSMHPLRHLLFIGCIFKNWETFWSVYSTCPNVDDCKNIVSCSKQSASRHRQIKDLALRLLTDGGSATEAARACCVSVHTIQSWATKAGLQVRVRRDNRRCSIIERLFQGISKSEVAQHCGVSIQTVTRTISSEMGLRAKWRDAVLQKNRIEAQSRWLNLKRQNPSSGNKQLRSLDKLTYAWLYRNDRQWLFENAAPRIKRTNSSKVNWQQRDDQLVQEIQAAIVRLRLNGGAEKFTPQEMRCAVPALSRFVSKLNKLPQTKKLLGTYTISHRRRYSKQKVN